MSLPLFTNDQGELTSFKGEVSTLSHTRQVDLEQYDDEQSHQYLEQVKAHLGQLNSTDFLKVYFKDHKCLTNSTDLGFTLNGALVEPIDRPIDLFIQGSSFSNIEFFDDYYLHNLRYYRIISFDEMPSELSPCELQQYGNYALIIKKVDQIKAQEKLKLKRKMHFSNLLKPIKDIDSEQAYSQAEDLLSNITTGDESLFKVAIYLEVSANTKKDLDRVTLETINSLELKGARLKVESRTLSRVFCETLPGSSPLFIRQHLIPLSYLVNLLPLKKDFIHKEGLTLSSISNHALRFNLFDSASHNYNALITGSSGQGKSMLANYLIDHYAQSGASGIILDLGGSFSKTAKFIDAEIAENSFNPLSFKDPLYLREFILSFTDKAWDQKDLGKLLKLIKESIDQVSNFRQLIDKLELSFEGLGFYFEDIWDHFHDKSEKTASLIYCDLDNYPARIKQGMIIYLIECFKNQSGRRIFIFDECWNLLNHHADYLANCFRTFRKHNASAVAISQNVDDFSGSALGRAIIQNTYYKFYFNQKISDSSFVSVYEKEVIKNLRSSKGHYSEFLISSESINKVTRFFPSTLQYELYTSDASDLAQFNKYMDKSGHYFSFQRAITNFTNLKYGNTL
jgi:type IV secretory pathway VirB4 component